MIKRNDKLELVKVLKSLLKQFGDSFEAIDDFQKHLRPLGTDRKLFVRFLDPTEAFYRVLGDS